MKPLRLGLSHLSAPETKLIQAYFRLYAYDSNFPWEISDVPPFNAVLIDRNQAGRNFTVAAEHMICIGDDPDAELQLKRPLRSDKLEALLRSLGQQGVARPLPSAATGNDDSSDDTFRLTGWPPAAILHRNPMRVKAATMMLRKYMSVAEIAKATNWNESDSRLFISILRNLGLLKATSSAHTPRAQTPSQQPKRSNPFLSSMISIFRQKLGLQHAGI